MEERNFPDMVRNLILLFSATTLIESRLRDDFQRLPIPELRILFWLMHLTLRSSRGAEVDGLPVAETILEIYCRELLRDLTNDHRVVVWVDDAPDALQLPWTDLAVVLGKASRSIELIEPTNVSWEAKIVAVPEVARLLNTEGNKDNLRSLFKAWFHKLRLHVRILLSMHQVLASNGRAASLLNSAQKNQVLNQIRQQLHALIQKFAAAQPALDRPSLFQFDLEFRISSYLTSSRLPDMADILSEGINSFPDAERDTTFACWVDAENDPRILLAISLHRLPQNVTELALTRLKQLDLEGFIQQSVWITDFMQLADKANQAGDIGLVELVLARGNARLQGRTLHEWDTFAFRMRLMLAYHRRDVSGIEQERLPSWASTAASGRGSVRDELEDSRRFYLGLALLESNPALAQQYFQELTQKHPGNAAYVANVFAASIMIARGIADPEGQRDALKSALSEFERNSAAIPQTRENLPQFALNRLICLDGASLDADFDAEWAKLDLDQKSYIDLLEVGVANATQRGYHERAQSLLNDARPFNLTAGGNPTDRFLKLEQSLGVAGSLS
ncbi:MAG: hypothetical protein ABL962_18715, partial [Fimbriimonadaceae bacterium]